MKKVLLSLAAICSMMMANAQELNYFSPVGTVGTLKGREAMVVDLGGEIGKVAIATMNVGATSVDDYGTAVDSNDGYDPASINLTDDWYIPTIEELVALQGIIQPKEDMTGYESQVGESMLTLPGFPKEMNGRTMYVGKYLSSSKPSATYHSLAFYFVPTTKIQAGDNRGQDFPCVIRPFHKLSTQFLYTTTDGKTIVLEDYFAKKVVSNTYADGQGVLTIGEYMDKLEEEAFYGCNNLSSIEIPASVKMIGDTEFLECSNLSTVTFAKGSQLEDFGGAFAFTPITSINLPAPVKKIADNAFLECSKLSSLTFAEGSQLVEIGEGAFQETPITSINLPASVKKIADNAFLECSKLSSLTFAEGSQLEEIGERAFLKTALTALFLPNKLETIGYQAFRETHLVSVVIPASVTFIADGAFEELYELASVVVLTERPPSLNGQNVFIRQWESWRFPMITIYVSDVEWYTYDSWWGRLKGQLEFKYYDGEYNAIAVNAVYTAMGDEKDNPYLLKFVADDIAAINNAEDAQTAVELLKNALDKVAEGLKLLESGDLYKFTDANGIRYNVTSEEDKTVEVVANEYAGDVIVPATVTIDDVTYSVTSIGEEAFFYCKGLTSVTLPEGLKSIGGFAFYECDSLKSITFPEGLESIGVGAFCGCDGLTSITLPEGLDSIGDGAFVECYNLASVTILQGLKSIGADAFAGCPSLTSVTLPEGLKSIGAEAFGGCYNLPSITIPNSVTSIGGGAFLYCDTLASVTLPEGLERIEDETFAGCRNLTSITLPQGLKTIGEGAFSDCYKLASITIPNSVTSIGAYAFAYCDTLASVILPEGLERIEAETFSDCDDLVSINIPSTVKSIGKWAFEYCESLESITLPEGLDSIGDVAFYGCVNLSSLTIPSTLRSIDDSTFGNCNISSISVAEGNTVYDSRENCNAIIETATNTLVVGSNNTVIPASVTAIGNYAFDGRHDLMAINIPNGVTKIGAYAFVDCDKLISIAIPGSVTLIDDEAFKQCTNLASITFSEGLKTIDSYAFYGCEKLTSLVLPNSLESITYCAFIDCTGLKSIMIPSTVKNLGNYAFAWCTGVESMTVLAATPPTLDGKYAFRDMNHNIPVYVTDVDAYSGWDGFTNFIAIELDSYKQAAIAAINSAKAGAVLTAEENITVNNCIATIENVELQTDENLAIIERAKNEALAIIIPATIRTSREAALAAIEEAMQGEERDYFTGLVQQYIDTINSAADVATITNAKNTALEILSTAVEAYKAAKSETLGTLRDKQDGPTLIVTDQDGNEVILYSPKRVEYIQVEE